MATKVYAESFYSQLIQSNMDATSVEVNVDVAPANSIGYSVLNNGEANQEIMKWTGKSGLTLNGLLRGLSLTALTDTEVAGNKKTHIINDSIEITDVHYFINDKISNSAYETIAGLKLFTLPPKGVSAAGSTTPSAPSAGAPTSGGSVTDGTHSYKISFLDSLGGETIAGSASGQITCGAGNNTVPLTGIPTGDDDTVSRKIYRTVAGDTGNYKLVDTISDNTTTTYSDTKADGSLGADALTIPVSYELMRFNETVRTTTNQTVGGLKTFTTLPQSSQTPSDDDDFTTKSYVDSRPAANLSYEEFYAGEDLVAPECVSRETQDNAQGGSSGDIGRDAISNGVWQAQSFLAGSDSSSFALDVSLKKVASPTDNLYIEIQTDNAGEPSGTVVTNGTSDNVDGSTLTTGFTDISFTWSAEPNIEAGNRYWFVIKRSGAGDDTNYYQAEYSSVNAFRSGAALKYTNSWTVNTGVNDDLVFTMTGVDAVVVKAINTSYNSSRGRLAWLGFINVDADEGNIAQIQTQGRLEGFTGLSPTSKYYIHTTGGEITTTESNILVGIAIDETSLNVGRQDVEGLVGEIKIWGSDTIPDGWLLCNDQAVSRTTYATLFSVIGTTFGIGDGATTFNVPDLRGKVTVGKDSGTFSTLGATGGEEEHTLTEAEMPTHSHNVAKGPNSGIGITTINAYLSNTGIEYTVPSEEKGSDDPHNNLQPYQVVNFIIKY